MRVGVEFCELSLVCCGVLCCMGGTYSVIIFAIIFLCISRVTLRGVNQLFSHAILHLLSAIRAFSMPAFLDKYKIAQADL